MADVLLTHSYHLPYDRKQVRKMQPYMPLGTLYAASALRRQGISVAVFDSMLQEPSQHFPPALTRHSPKIVAVYEDDFNFLSKMCLTRMREVAWEIAAAAQAVDAKVVVHGSDSTDNPRLFLENGFDYVLCGEAEQTLVELCSAILRGSRVSDIEGLLSRDDTPAHAARVRQLARNPGWEDLPAPSRDLIDFAPYRAAWMDAHGYFSVNLVSSRGCPYHCNWCAKPVSGSKFHLRPAASVAEEMRRLKHEAHVQHVWFGDDVFALDHRWNQQFATEVVKRDAVIPFKIQSRADLMSEETVRALKTAGCAEVWMGVESVSQTILDAMDKGLKISSVIAARHRLHEAGIRACYFLQLGYPGETLTELRQTIAFVRKTRPDDIGVSFSYPLPGTVFYDRVQAQLGSKRNWKDSDDLCVMFHAVYTTEFYRAVRDALHAEVDSWHSSSENTSLATELEELWRKVDELEPTSKNPDALFPQAGPVPALSLASIVPLNQLAGIWEA
ncbi:MAG: B12-binding domain-containing radical SAM protein [Terracidiphilus sp.]